jgi:general secretion pathway protein K
VAEAIADWRDEDSDRRPHGAENFDYQTRGYVCKDGPFENVEELLLVKGMTPELYHQVEEHVTVFGSGRVNLNTAGRDVLQTLGLSSLGLEGLLAFRDGGHLTSLAGLQSDLAAFIPQEDLNRLDHWTREQVLSVGSQAFRMRIQAQTDLPISRVEAWCVVDRDGAIRLWSE